jgi:hypothetical protein
MPGERQPTLPALEQLVPPELLNPTREAAGATPAERAQAAASVAATTRRPACPSLQLRRAATAPPPPTTPPVQPTVPFGGQPSPDASTAADRDTDADATRDSAPAGQHALSSAATEAAILAAAGRVTDPLRPLPFAFAKRHGVLVRAVTDDGADVLIRDGATPTALAEVRRHLRRPLRLERVSVERFEVMLREAYEAGSGTTMDAMGGLEEEGDLAHLAQDIPEPSDLLESEDEAPVIRLINALLTQAVKENASDIHVEPFENRLVIRFPRRRRAARGAADQARGRTADRLSHQGHVAPRHRREAIAAGRPHLAANCRTRSRCARLDDSRRPR